MINRPKIMISIFIFNSDGTKILVGKKYDEGTWSTINGKLDYGEGFEDCAARILCNTANILLEDPERIKFLCSYNAVDKSRNLHIVSVDYFVQVTKEEEKFDVKVDQYYFQSWNWYSIEEIFKMYDNLFLCFKTFLKKFNIKNLEDIKNINSN